jgi:PST family polysaccharide transporter
MIPALLVALPGVAFMIATADVLVPTVLGSQWIDVAPIFVGLGVAGLLQPLNAPASWLFLSQGRTREYMFWGLFSAATSITAFVIGLPYGPLGVATAYSLSEIIRTPILWWIVGKRGPIGHRDIIVLATPHIVGAALSLLVVSRLHHWWLKQSLLDISLCLALSYLLSFSFAYVFPASRREIRRYMTSGMRMLASNA